MKGLADIIGHREIVLALRNAVDKQKAAHAFLFSGQQGVGKKTTAMAFARALLCQNPCAADACGQCQDCRLVCDGTHPDLHVLKPDGASIKIQQVRQLQRSILLSPHQGHRQVYILECVEKMTVEAANSLLKNLEEPPTGVVYILLTEQPYGLLPTITSRCQNFTFRPLSIKEVESGLNGIAGLNADDVHFAAALSGGSLGKAQTLLSQGQYKARRDDVIKLAANLRRASLSEISHQAEEMAQDKPTALAQLDLLLQWYRDLLIWRETAFEDMLINRDRVSDIDIEASLYTTGRLIDIISDIELAKGQLSANANTRLVLDILLVRLAG